jgi:hypothetical protein
MANPQSNRTDITVTPADMTTITTGFGSINTALATYTQALTEGERESLFGMKEENLVFAGDAIEQGVILQPTFPAMIVDILTRTQTDYNLANQMDQLIKQYIEPLLKLCQDSRRLASHEAYVGALALYKVIEAGAALGLPGYQAAYDILKVRFAGQGTTPQQPEL